MTNERRFIVGLAAGLLVTSVGCAASNAGSGAAEQARIEVANDLVPSTPVTVFTIDETGAARRIGFIPGGRAATLAFPVSGESRNYRFSATAEAAPPAGTLRRPPAFSDNSAPSQPLQAGVTSAPIQIGPTSNLVWHLSDNIVLRSDQ